ncbi:alpha/beta hydrolase [Aspergillus stella-maris]|uniref:alpha/beta hydrolase n=1 Tax=Aspergillus stella-maris TaxID=1810926 RepID=UPI003CCD5555
MNSTNRPFVPHAKREGQVEQQEPHNHKKSPSTPPKSIFANRMLYLPFYVSLSTSKSSLGSRKSKSTTKRNCITFNLKIPVTAPIAIYDAPRVDNSIDAVDFVWDLQRWTAPNISDRIRGFDTIRETFTINAQLCKPTVSVARNLSRAGILHIATHGPWFDKSYWDPELDPEKYSYVDAALDAGYSVLTYDRLGMGKSSKPDAYTALQASVQMEILKELILLARGRSGSLSTSPSSSPSFFSSTFKEIVLIGHSFGSGINMALLQKYSTNPALPIDAAIFTGLLVRGRNQISGIGYVAFGLDHAGSNDPARFADRGSGYMVQASARDVNQVFFKKGFFDPKMLEYAVHGKETVAVGEFMSLGNVLGRPVGGFRGAALFVHGENDFTSCVGNCTASVDIAGIREAFPDASDVSVHIQKGSGHAVTLHENARDVYDVVFDYLRRVGL